METMERDVERGNQYCSVLMVCLDQCVFMALKVGAFSKSERSVV